MRFGGSLHGFAPEVVPRVWTDCFLTGIPDRNNPNVIGLSQDEGETKPCETTGERQDERSAA